MFFFSLMACIQMELVVGLKSNFLCVLCNFIKEKSDVALEDVHNLIQKGLEIFHVSRNKHYA